MPGPVFAVTLAKSYKDKWAGVFISIGHGLIEFPIMFLIYFGFAPFFASKTLKTSVAFIGGIVMICLGIQMILERKKIALTEKDLPYNSLGAGIITTASSPHFFVWWASLGSALILTSSKFGFLGFILFALVHWLSDLLWYVLISFTIFKSKHIWSKKVHEIIISISAVILAGFGIWFVLSAGKF